MRHPILAALGVALVITGCDQNESGNIAATKFGDLSHPADRGSPIAELRAACGDGEMMTPAGEVVRRLPYVQQTTTTSATIGWVTVQPDGERAIVTLPDGTPVTTVDATVQNGTQRNAGEKQMWARVTGLSPDTVYCYELANGAPMSGRTGFKTAPAADSIETIRLMAFGDSGGGGADQHALAEQMFDLPYDFIIHTGDLAYDDGTIGQFEDNVFGVYFDLFKNLPFFPSAGNHEYRTMQGAPFREVFALPGDASRKYYSYDWGRIHLAALDTEDSYEEQAAWLDADLAQTDRPWKIVYLHKPPYSSGNHGSDTRLRQLLAPILERHHVQLLLAGHDHHYERMNPQHGVDYVVTGGGGKGTYDVGTSSFTAFSESVIHFVTLEVGVDEAILHAIDATGVEFDSMVIPRTR
jgi:hypothetical protein